MAGTTTFAPYIPRPQQASSGGGRSSRPWYGAVPAWLRGTPPLGAGGNVVGKGWAPPGAPKPSVGSKPRHKHMDPHLRYGTALPGMHGDAPLIGAVGSKPHKHRDPHLRYGSPSVHGDLNITHGAGGVVTITHQPHGEDAGDAATPGATDAQEPNYGSGSIAVDADPVVNDVDLYVGMAHGIGTPGSFDATLAGGGMSPDSMQQGFDLYNDLDDTMNDIPSTFHTVYDDPYAPPLREPNKRNYKADFGLDAEMGYAGFGPAAIIGCEEDLITAGDIGCENDTAVKA